MLARKSIYSHSSRYLELLHSELPVEVRRLSCIRLASQLILPSVFSTLPPVDISRISEQYQQIYEISNTQRADFETPSSVLFSGPARRERLRIRGRETNHTNKYTNKIKRNSTIALRHYTTNTTGISQYPLALRAEGTERRHKKTPTNQQQRTQREFFKSWTRRRRASFS